MMKIQICTCALSCSMENSDPRNRKFTIAQPLMRPFVKSYARIFASTVLAGVVIGCSDNGGVTNPVSSERAPSVSAEQPLDAKFYGILEGYAGGHAVAVQLQSRGYASGIQLHAHCKTPDPSKLPTVAFNEYDDGQHPGDMPGINQRERDYNVIAARCRELPKAVDRAICWAAAMAYYVSCMFPSGCGSEMLRSDAAIAAASVYEGGCDGGGPYELRSAGNPQRTGGSNVQRTPIDTASIDIFRIRRP